MQNFSYIGAVSHRYERLHLCRGRSALYAIPPTMFDNTPSICLHFRIVVEISTGVPLFRITVVQFLINSTAEAIR